MRFSTSAFGMLLTIALCVASAAAQPIPAKLEPVPEAPNLLRDPNSYTLAEIITRGGIVVGDKLFDAFNVTTVKSANAVAPGTAEIEITPIQVLKQGATEGGDYGFIVTGAWFAPAGQLADSTIEFRASILPEFVRKGYAFHDNALWMTAFGSNAGAISISENLYASHPSSGNAPFVNELVYYGNDGNNQLRDAATFSPVAQMWVVKDVLVYGGAHLSEFYQTFSQCPEPGTFLLLTVVASAAAACLFGRRFFGRK